MDKAPDAFRTISEVAEFLETPAHVLRFWESRFPQIRPVKRAGGRRYYRPADIALLSGIKRLLHDDGMTIRGVQKILREHGVRHVAALGGEEGGAEDEAALLEAALAEAYPQAGDLPLPPAEGETAQIVALIDALRSRQARSAGGAQLSLFAEGEAEDAAAPEAPAESADLPERARGHDAAEDEAAGEVAGGATAGDAAIGDETTSDAAIISEGIDGGEIAPLEEVAAHFNAEGGPVAPRPEAEAAQEQPSPDDLRAEAPQDHLSDAAEPPAEAALVAADVNAEPTGADLPDIDLSAPDLPAPDLPPPDLTAELSAPPPSPMPEVEQDSLLPERDGPPSAPLADAPLADAAGMLPGPDAGLPDAAFAAEAEVAVPLAGDPPAAQEPMAARPDALPATPDPDDDAPDNLFVADGAGEAEAVADNIFAEPLSATGLDATAAAPPADLPADLPTAPLPRESLGEATGESAAVPPQAEGDPAGAGAATETAVAIVISETVVEITARPTARPQGTAGLHPAAMALPGLPLLPVASRLRALPADAMAGHAAALAEVYARLSALRDRMAGATADPATDR